MISSAVRTCLEGTHSAALPRLHMQIAGCLCCIRAEPESACRATASHAPSTTQETLPPGVHPRSRWAAALHTCTELQRLWLLAARGLHPSTEAAWCTQHQTSSTRLMRATVQALLVAKWPRRLEEHPRTAVRLYSPWVNQAHTALHASSSVPAPATVATAAGDQPACVLLCKCAAPHTRLPANDCILAVYGRQVLAQQQQQQQQQQQRKSSCIKRTCAALMLICDDDVLTKPLHWLTAACLQAMRLRQLPSTLLQQEALQLRALPLPILAQRQSL